MTEPKHNHPLRVAGKYTLLTQVRVVFVLFENCLVFSTICSLFVGCKYDDRHLQSISITMTIISINIYSNIDLSITQVSHGTP